MALLPRLASLWRNLSDKESLEQELNEELRAHLDLLTEQKISQGLKPEEARRAALLDVGGIEQVKERVREVRTGRPLEDLSQDLRYALRGLRKHRGFTVDQSRSTGRALVRVKDHHKGTKAQNFQ